MLCKTLCFAYPPLAFNQATAGAPDLQSSRCPDRFSHLARTICTPLNSAISAIHHVHLMRMFLVAAATNNAANRPARSDKN